MRPNNLPITDRYKLTNMFPIVIIPGTSEPRDLNPYFQELFQDIASLSNDGFIIDSVPFYVFLSGLFADAPARNKLLKVFGTSAKKGCPFCMIIGESVQGKDIIIKIAYIKTNVKPSQLLLQSFTNLWVNKNVRFKDLTLIAI